MSKPRSVSMKTFVFSTYVKNKETLRSNALRRCNGWFPYNPFSIFTCMVVQLESLSFALNSHHHPLII